MNDMNKIEKKLKEQRFKTRMLLQIHDELIFEAPDNEVEEVSKLIKTEMENIVNLKVPFIAEVGFGDNWAEAH